jgi:hypothetical protein
MEVKLLDAILHGELKPWKLDASNTRRFTELVKAAKAASPTTTAELQKQLAILLADYPTLQKLLAVNSFADNTAVKMLLYKGEFPKYKDPITQYYFILIIALSLRFWNNFLKQSENWTHDTDIKYQVTKTLKGISVLTKQTATELHEQGFTTIPDEQSSFIHFALYYLKHSLIQLYFSIQESFKDSLVQVTTLEDFYLLDLEESKGMINELIKIDIVPSEEVKSIAQSGDKPFSFGFKGDEAKLRNLISVLCTHKNLLDESVTKPDDFVKLLTTKDINDKDYKIQIGCETNLFQHVVDMLKFTSPKFNYANIGRCKYFTTKNGIPIQASLLSNSKSNNPLPKKTKEEINKIFKENDM